MEPDVLGQRNVQSARNSKFLQTEIDATDTQENFGKRIPQRRFSTGPSVLIELR